MPTEKQNGWNEWSRHVLAELERHNSLLESYNEKLNAITAELVALKIRAGLWGGLAGLVPGIVAILVVLFRH